LPNLAHAGDHARGSDGAGRGLRVVAGGALIVAGIAIGGTGGTIVAIVGVVPLAAGVFNVCLFAPLFGLDFMGRKRAAG
jgi:hypothetical protein